MKFIVPILLLLCQSAFGQLIHLSPCAQAAILHQASSSFDPTSISGMFAFWDYRTLTTNNAVSTWVDSISASNMVQATGSAQPTNSALGVWFDGNDQLATATSFNVASNSTLWAVVQKGSADVGYQDLLADSGGSGFLTHLATPSIYFGGDHLFGSAQLNGSSYDVLWAFKQGYTNGVDAGTTTANGAAFTFQNIGGHGSENWLGYIKFIGVWTNKTLTATDALNLYNWSVAH